MRLPLFSRSAQPEKPPRAGLADWFGRLLSLAFVAVAGAVAMQMAYAAGADDIRRWTMTAIVGAGLAVVAFGPGLTLGRGRILAAICLLPVWLAAVSYNGLSALEYFDRYLADAEARQRIGADLFREQRDELQRLRAQREAIKTVRPVATIEAEMSARRLSQREQDRLAVEIEDARARDRLDDQIRDVAGKLSGATAKGDADTSRHLAPLFLWLTEVTGVTIASAKDLRALLLLLITEMGAALVPVAMALSSGRRRVPTLRRAAESSPAPEPKPAVPSHAEREDARAIMTWMDVRTCRSPGGRAEAADLYADYSAWIQARGQPPVTKTRFGSVLSEDCGLAKRKAGAKWTVNYLGVELKPSGHARGRGFGLLAIAGGRAA